MQTINTPITCTHCTTQMHEHCTHTQTYPPWDPDALELCNKAFTSALTGIYNNKQQSYIHGNHCVMFSAFVTNTLVHQ